MSRRRLFFTLVLVAVLCMPAAKPLSAETLPETAASCTCSPEPLDQQWRKSAAVFTGTVANIKIIAKLDSPGIADKPVEVTVSVEKIFKGVRDDAASFTFFSNLSRRTCMGYPYEKGVQYVFFAYERVPYEAREWSMYQFPSATYDVGGLCGGTRKLSDAADIMDRLDALAAEEKEKSGFLKKILK